MDTDELTKRLFGDVEPTKPALGPEKVRLIVERVLSRNNLTLSSLDMNEDGDYIAKSTDAGGSRIFSVIRLESSDTGIERGSLEDFHHEALEKNSDRSIFITDSVFTEEARLFAAEKYITLVDGKEIESISTEEEVGIEKAFVSGTTDEGVRRYFESRRKKKKLLIFGTEESIEEIDKRYAPVACYMISYTGEDVVERTRVYVDLAHGDIYRVERGRVEKSDVIKRVMDLPESTRGLFIELLEHKRINEEHISGKDLELLRRRGLVVTKIKEETKGNIFMMIIDEVLDAVRLFSRAGSEFGGKSSQAATIERDYEVEQTRSKIVSPDIKIKKFDNTHDLEFFVETTTPEADFDRDEVKYDKEEVAKILDAITEEQEEISFQYLAYMPYYKCTYRGRDRYRYLRYSPLFFKKR